MGLDIDGDLFDIATSLAGLLGAPVTIEDRDTIVIAYSGGNQDVDEARIGTILGRQVPVHYRDAIAGTGVFEKLRRSDDVITVDLPAEHMVARAVVAVRDEGQLIGSIWAAIPGGPTPSQAETLRAAAPRVARRLREESDLADRGRRARTDLVAALLAGGDAADEIAADRTMTGEWVAVSIRGGDPDAIRRAVGPLALHLSAIAPSALCAAYDRGIVGVLPADSAVRILDDFLRRFGARDLLVVGIGTPAEAGDLAESRAVADQVADALVRRGRTGVVATLDDVFADVLVDRLDGFLHRHRASSPLTRLREHDRNHESGLVDAVRAFLEAGEVSAAAEALTVHPNTIRNRLRRARESCRVDVGDPATRLALMIDLRSAR
ncbi:PucR family transcriptional regulator [Nocardioides jensenii]|uniref:PucR family transcriptional regulator n=1 Tax=Nocardioides jensenii TaxID=1843 RepID=UPI000831B85B|nr:helix-turn-helix domain-containing protein [Nocardioides jensenii]